MLKGCISLDQTALNFFVKKYYPILAQIASKKIGNPEDREDTIQSFLLKIIRLKFFSKFRGNSEADFTAFLLRSFYNAIKDYYRSKSIIISNEDTVDFSERDYMLLIEYDTPNNIFFKKELLLIMKQKVEKLPLGMKLVMKLRLAGYTNQEISEIIEKPKGTVDTWAAKALRILQDQQKKLQAYWDDRSL